LIQEWEYYKQCFFRPCINWEFIAVITGSACAKRENKEFVNRHTTFFGSPDSSLENLRGQLEKENICGTQSINQSINQANKISPEM
jgi:hypothetical protein